MGYYANPYAEPACGIECPVCHAKLGELCHGTVADFHYKRERDAAARA